jgi:hypothetical protein
MMGFKLGPLEHPMGHSKTLCAIAGILLVLAFTSAAAHVDLGVVAGALHHHLRRSLFRVPSVSRLDLASCG